MTWKGVIITAQCDDPLAYSLKKYDHREFLLGPLQVITVKSCLSASSLTSFFFFSLPSLVKILILTKGAICQGAGMPTLLSFSLLKLCKRLQSSLNQYVPYHLNNRIHNSQCHMDIGGSRYSRVLLATTTSGHLHFKHVKIQKDFKWITKAD